MTKLLFSENVCIVWAVTWQLNFMPLKRHTTGKWEEVCATCEWRAFRSRHYLEPCSLGDLVLSHSRQQLLLPVLHVLHLGHLEHKLPNGSLGRPTLIGSSAFSTGLMKEISRGLSTPLFTVDNRRAACASLPSGGTRWGCVHLVVARPASLNSPVFLGALSTKGNFIWGYIGKEALPCATERKFLWTLWKCVGHLWIFNSSRTV